MSREEWSQSDRRLLDAVPDALASGVELLDWWQHADAENSYRERWNETITRHRPGDISYGFFDSVDLSTGRIPIIGNVQQMFYDGPKAPPDYEGAAEKWMHLQVREFILKYFMRISDFRKPELVAESREAPPPGLSSLSQCSSPSAEIAGFGFSQLFYKRRDGEIGRFPAEQQHAIVELTDLRENYEWIVLRNPIHGFGFDVRVFGRLFENLLGAAGPELRLPASVFNYLVISGDFIVDEEIPPGEDAEGIVGRYGFGYAFVDDPEPSVYGYGPGRLQPAFEQLVWEVHETGHVRVRAAFVAKEPDGVLRLSVDPLAWGFQFTKAIGGKTPGFLQPFKRAWRRLPYSDATFDPVFPAIDMLNFMTAGQAAKRFCISKSQVMKQALFLHFRQHYQTILGSLQTWRQVKDWQGVEEPIPEWVVSGRSS